MCFITIINYGGIIMNKILLVSMLFLLSIAVLLAGCGGEVDMQAPAAQDSDSQAADGASESADGSAEAGAEEGAVAEGSNYAVVPTSGEYVVRDKENLFEGVHKSEDDGVFDTTSKYLGMNKDELWKAVHADMDDGIIDVPSTYIGMNKDDLWKAVHADMDDGILETSSALAESRKGFGEHQPYSEDGVFEVGSTYLGHELDDNDWRGVHADQDDGTIQTESAYLGRQAVETLNEVEHHTRDRTVYTGYGQYNYD